MSMTCDTEYWTPDPKEVDHLTLFGTEPHAICTIALVDSIAPWQAGRAAGLSGGTTTDEKRRKANWASAFSKATKHNKKILPHIAALKERLLQFRSDGGETQSVSWRDKLVRCEWLILHGTPSESLRAIDMHNKMKGQSDKTPSTKDFVSTFVAKVGPERTRRGLEEFGAGHLIYAVPDLFLEHEKMENDNERPDERRAGDDPRNLNSRGLRRVCDDAAGKMDKGSGIAGGADPGERSDGSRDIEGRLSELEKLEEARL